MNHYSIILPIFQYSGYKTFLELGVYLGEGLSTISQIAEYALGVDGIDNRINKQTNLFLGSTQSFFSQNTKKFDAIFVDANHNFEPVFFDLLESIKILNPNGTIFIHDTDPSEPHLIVPNNPRQEYCGDGYKIHKVLEEYNFSWVTLPVDRFGLTIVRRKTDLKHLSII